MGNPSTDSKAIIGIIILPIVLLLCITFWFDYQTKQLIISFQESPNYSELRAEKNIPLMVIMGEESTHRATVVNFGIMTMYVTD